MSNISKLRTAILKLYKVPIDANNVHDRTVSCQAYGKKF